MAAEPSISPFLNIDCHRVRRSLVLTQTASYSLMERINDDLSHGPWWSYVGRGIAHCVV